MKKLTAVFATKSLLVLGGDECDNLNFKIGSLKIRKKIVIGPIYYILKFVKFEFSINAPTGTWNSLPFQIRLTCIRCVQMPPSNSAIRLINNHHFTTFIHPATAGASDSPSICWQCALYKCSYYYIRQWGYVFISIIVSQLVWRFRKNKLLNRYSRKVGGEWHKGQGRYDWNLVVIRI